MSLSRCLIRRTNVATNVSRSAWRSTKNASLISIQGQDCAISRFQSVSTSTHSYSTRTAATTTPSSIYHYRRYDSFSYHPTPLSPTIQRINYSPRVCTAAVVTTPVHFRSMATLTNTNPPTAVGASSSPSSIEYSRPFSELTNLQPTTVQAIQSTFGYEHMSKVQHSVLSALPTQRDLLVKAKTGTGKTLAFLVAALESLMASPQTGMTAGEVMVEGSFKQMGGKIGCVIVAPTRELALQISDEAQKLLEPLGWGVQYLVGGENKSQQLDRISKEAAEFVVATPGRLKDLLGNKEFAAKIAESKVLVLDEADTMLQLGFRLELDSILKAMPKDRQTFLFSATVDSKLDSLLEVALHHESKDHQGPIMIDTVGAKEINLNLATHQQYCLAPYQSHVALVRRIINDHLLSDMDMEHQESLKKPKAIGGQRAQGNTKVKSNSAVAAAPGALTAISKGQQRDNKIMVFLPTTRGAQLYAKVFATLSMGKELSVFEIHSAKDQRARTLTSRNFRKIQTPAVLFTSDVSARGIDYPGVGLVIQVGAPLSLDHYIHRIGRTGRGDSKKSSKGTRKGSEKDDDHHGKGVLILGELDEGFIEHQLKPSPLFSVMKQERKFDDWQSVMLGENLDRGFKRALSKVDEKLAKSAYTAFLGY
ncbi:P-loop containing nucleoside triphosphate hydrolase protein, partial [Dissophora ornata]